MAKKSFLDAFLELAIYWVLVATSLQIVSILIVLKEPHARYSFVTALMLIASTIIFIGAFYVLWRSLSPMFARANMGKVKLSKRNMARVHDCHPSLPFNV